MESSQKTPNVAGQLDPAKLAIVHYPDPVLRRPAAAVTNFDPTLRALAERMCALMRAAAGVGLAAPQVGVPIRLFVSNVTGQPQDTLIFVNPVIRDPQGTSEAQEGCLSLPGVTVQIRRAAHCRITAQDLEGRPVEMQGRDLISRVWQHETDHLNGILILDRMGPADRIATRKTLKALEDAYKARR